MAKKKGRTKYQSLVASVAAACSGRGTKATARKRATAYVKHAVSTLGRSASAADKKKAKAEASRIAKKALNKPCKTKSAKKKSAKRRK